jgi:hypothetical protein
MPTSRPRHLITETDEVERAIDDAAERWPADAGRRARLLVHLIEEGHRAVLQERDQRLEERRRAIRETSGILTGVYPSDYLKKLREEWPE